VGNGEDGDNNTLCVISLYVDDILIAGCILPIVQRVKDNNYDMKGVIHILKAKYIMYILKSFIQHNISIKDSIEKFFGTEFTSCDTPSDINITLSRNMSPTSEVRKQKMTKIPYRVAEGTVL